MKHNDAIYSSGFNSPQPVSRAEQGQRAAFARLGLSLMIPAMLVLAGCTESPSAAPAKDAASANDSIEKTVEKGPVKLTIRVSPKQPRLSDTIALELIVRADPAIEIKKPEFGKGVHEFTIRDYDIPPEKVEDGKLVRRYRYKLEAERAGKLLIRSQQVEYVDKQTPVKDPAKRTFVLSAPLEIDVTTEIAGKAPELSDLALMAEPVPLEPKPIPPWLIAVIAAAVAALIAGIVYAFKRKRIIAKAAEIVRTPEEIARAELDALLNEKLAEREEFKEFYVRLTGIVRRYIERKTGIHAPEQTTEEFLHDPATRRMFSLDQAQRLGQFLEAADMVKYAAMRPGPRELDEAVDRAKEFIGMSAALAPKPVETAKRV